MKSVLFVSYPAIQPSDLPAELHLIELVSRRRNAEAQVTGALMCTEWQFAGVLEGEPRAVEVVMERIHLDRRHQKILVADERVIATRSFVGWKLAYWGDALYARKLVSPLFLEPSRASATNLRTFLREMAR